MVYIEVWHKHGKDWQRIDINNLDDFQYKDSGNVDCFRTIQEYANPNRSEDEEYEANFYFDLDSADLEKSKQDTIKIITFLESLDLSEADTKVYFSGNKGFHIIVDKKALGLKPSKTLHKVFKHVALYCSFLLGTKDNKGNIIPLECIDTSVYTKKRMFRLNNSIHSKTNLYKIQLSFNELKNLSIKEIKEFAVTRRDVDIPSKLKKVLKAVEFFEDKRKEVELLIQNERIKSNSSTFEFNKDTKPVCVNDILTNGWKKEGDRNQATIQLACYFKEANYSQEETSDILAEWVKKFTSARSDYEKNRKAASTVAVVNSIYTHDNYKFDCGFIRSLHSEKTSTGYERVACTGSLCECLKKEKIENNTIEIMNLSDSSDANKYGTLIRTKIRIAGKKQTPFLIPKKFEYVCSNSNRKNCKKINCPLKLVPTGIAYKELDTSDRELIQMCGVGDDNVKATARALSGIFECKKYKIEYIEHINVEELLVIPMADGVSTYDDNAKDGKYVLRKIYSIGNTIEISENKYYEITGWVFPHPKNQEGTIIIHKAVPLQDEIEKFKITDDFNANCKIFQPANDTIESIHTKLVEICKELSYNVTHIIERDDLLLGALLVLHSLLRFEVPWDSVPMRGWLEMIIIGDTGTGKSATIEKLMDYIKLGTRVNAESTSRTGLTYKMEQTSGSGTWYIVWGAWPLADKEFIWIDEASGISKEEYGQMTMARSSGVMEVKRAVTAETPCRVRAILSTNAPKGRKLGDYAYGVQALTDIFNNEDIRRFDFSVFLKTSDVKASNYNTTFEEQEKLITGKVLRENMLYCWSRKSKEVSITKRATDKILQTATQLSKVYGKAVDTPLVSPSDQRNKLVRLSAALAGLLHSVDDSGDNIVVKEVHVEYITNYLKALYNNKNCSLNYYARIAIEDIELEEDQYDKIVLGLNKHTSIKSDTKFLQFIKLFASQNYFRYNDLEAILNLEREDAKALVNILIRANMVKLSTSGYRKTPKFNAFISKSFELGKLDNIQEEELF